MSVDFMLSCYRASAWLSQSSGTSKLGSVCFRNLARAGHPAESNGVWVSDMTNQDEADCIIRIPRRSARIMPGGASYSVLPRRPAVLRGLLLRALMLFCGR